MPRRAARARIAACLLLASLAPCCADPAPVIHYAPVENLEHVDVALIDHAQHEIDMAAYVLTDWPVMQALTRAARSSAAAPSCPAAGERSFTSAMRSNPDASSRRRGAAGVVRAATSSAASGCSRRAACTRARLPLAMASRNRRAAPESMAAAARATPSRG